MRSSRSTVCNAQSAHCSAGRSFDGAASYAKRHYDAAMRTQLEVGFLEFCRIEERRFELLYGFIEGEPHPSPALSRAHALGAMF